MFWHKKIVGPPSRLKETVAHKNALETFFSHLEALTNCKVSEKSNERFPRKSLTDERTDGQTWLLRSQRPVGRETKKSLKKVKKYTQITIEIAL